MSKFEAKKNGEEQESVPIINMEDVFNELDAAGKMAMFGTTNWEEALKTREQKKQVEKAKAELRRAEGEKRAGVELGEARKQVHEVQDDPSSYVQFFKVEEIEREMEKMATEQPPAERSLTERLKFWKK